MNIQKMMKQAQQMQQKLAAAQSEIEKREAEGSAGGGAVKITLNGKGQLVSVALGEGALDDREMLEDLITAAHRDAKEKIDAIINDTMGSATGDLGLPAGMKLPF